MATTERFEEILNLTPKQFRNDVFALGKTGRKSDASEKFWKASGRDKNLQKIVEAVLEARTGNKNAEQAFLNVFVPVEEARGLVRMSMHMDPRVIDEWAKKIRTQKRWRLTWRIYWILSVTFFILWFCLNK